MMIRHPEMKDVVAVATIHVRSWQEGYRGLIADNFLDSLTIEKRMRLWHWMIETHPERIGLYTVKDEVAGFVSFEQCRDPFRNGDVGEISAIYLLKQFWFMGIGRALMAFALKRLKEQGYEEAMLWVLNTNQQAIDFYKRMGFIPSGRHKDETIGGDVVTEIEMIRGI